jgi:dTDP-4-dehydrorhamnose 3,5-epimerase
MNHLARKAAKEPKWEADPLSLAGVKLIRPVVVMDARGYFVETYQRSRFAEAGIIDDFIQDNQSGSISKGTVRGLHFQIPPFAQTKLIRVLRGRILDVIVDLRRSSETYGKHMAIELAHETGHQLLVPAGLAHGFCTLTANAEVFYKVDQIYSPRHERGLNWADLELGIDWPIKPADAVLSDRDRSWPLLRELPPYFSTIAPQ